MQLPDAFQPLQGAEADPLLLLCASTPRARTKAERSRIPSHFPAGFAFALVAIAPPAATKFSWDPFLVPQRALALIRAGAGWGEVEFLAS